MPHTPNEFAGSDSDRIEQAIAAAVADGSRRLHIPAENAGRNEEVWILDRAIVIPSGFALILDRSRLRLAPGVRDNVVRNAAADGAADAEPDRSLEVLGLGQTRPVLTGCAGKAVLRLDHADGFTVGNLDLRGGTSAVDIGAGCRNGRVYNVRFAGDGARRAVGVRSASADLRVQNVWSPARPNRLQGDDCVSQGGVCRPDEARTSATLVPAPRKLRYTGGEFFAPSPYVTRDWIAFSRDRSLPPEGYRLSVARRGVTVAAADADGEFHALQTLRQLADEKTPYLNLDHYTGGDNGLPLRIPCCVVEDWPAFRWRGMMLDEGRHFFGKETVKSLLDLLAYHKINVFHWHLTEDQGWRLAIDKYPRLAKFASVRPQSPVHYACAPDSFNGETYGPFFYTKDEVREIVSYAAARRITVVPEIEIPGHGRAALAAYPEFSCAGRTLPRVPRLQWGIEEDVFCVGNDRALRFFEDVLDEVCELFPGPFVHFGGDECPTTRWKACPKCRARAREVGVAGPEKLQGWVTRHFAEYLARKGRRAIGWDEILDCDIPKEACVMSWRGTGGAVRGAAGGHDVVLAPSRPCYLSCPQGLADDPFAPRPERGITLEETYRFDPLADIPPADRGHVLGSQMCMWSERCWNRYDLEWKLWPRGCALAEVFWSHPAVRDFDAFLARLEPHRRRLIHMGVNAAPLR